MNEDERSAAGQESEVVTTAALTSTATEVGSPSISENPALDAQASQLSKFLVESDKEGPSTVTIQGQSFPASMSLREIFSNPQKTHRKKAKKKCPAGSAAGPSWGTSFSSVTNAILNKKNAPMKSPDGQMQIILQDGQLSSNPQTVTEDSNSLTTDLTVKQLLSEIMKKQSKVSASKRICYSSIPISLPFITQYNGSRTIPAIIVPPPPIVSSSSTPLAASPSSSLIASTPTSSLLSPVAATLQPSTSHPLTVSTQIPTTSSSLLSSELLPIAIQTDITIPSSASSASSGNECGICKANKKILTTESELIQYLVEEKDDGEFSHWIQCDHCQVWYHKICVEFKDFEDDLIDKYYCPKCHQEGHDIIYRPTLLDHRYDFWDKKQTNLRIEIGTKAWIEEFVKQEAQIPAPDESECHVFETGNEFMDLFHSELKSRNWDKVYLIKKSEGLQIRMPDDPDFSIDDVARIFGDDYRVDTIDVYRQATYSMKIGDFRQKLQSGERPRLYNFLSLEFSDNPAMKQHVAPPILVNHISFVHKLWPEVDDPVNYESFSSERQKDMSVEDKIDKPNVALFCLAGMGGSFTDCHIDFGGSSVWYHIWKGQKIFYIAPPTPQNLRIYEVHQIAKNKTERFLMDEMEFKRVVISEGETLMIPSGWIHCVYTPIDSLVFGGNYLHMLNVPMQLKIYEMEERIKESTKLDSKFFFPNFELVNWYAARSLVFDALKEANDEGNVAEPAVLAAAKALIPRLRTWTTRDRAAGSLDQSDTGPEDVVARLEKELNKQERIIHESSPDRHSKKQKRKKKAKRISSDNCDLSTEASPFTSAPTGETREQNDDTSKDIAKMEVGENSNTALKIRIPRASVQNETSPPLSAKFSLERAGELYQNSLDAGEPVIHDAISMFSRKSSSGRARKPAKWLEAFAGEQIEKESIKLEESGNQPTQRPPPLFDAALDKVYKEEEKEEMKAKRRTGGKKQSKQTVVKKVSAAIEKKSVVLKKETPKQRLAKKLGIK